MPSSSRTYIQVLCIIESEKLMVRVEESERKSGKIWDLSSLYFEIVSNLVRWGTGTGIYTRGTCAELVQVNYNR